MIDSIIEGKVWVCGDNVSAVDICPQRRWVPGKLREEHLGKWALEDVAAEFLDKEWGLKNTGCTIIVAGKGFGGGGKSIEHPVYALKGAGVRLVLADSFARYNYRNSIDKGLPAFVCEGLRDIVRSGDPLTVDLKNGFAVNQRGQRRDLIPAAPFILELLEAGGILPYTRMRLNSVFVRHGQEDSNE